MGKRVLVMGGLGFDSVTTARAIIARDVPKEGLWQKDFTHDDKFKFEDLDVIGIPISEN